MEILGILNVPGWILTIILVIITLYLYSLWQHSLWRRLGIPGPTPVPFLGIMLQFIKKGIVRTDIELVEKYGEVVGYIVAYWWRKPQYPEKTGDIPQVNDKRYHIMFIEYNSPQ